MPKMGILFGFSLHCAVRRHGCSVGSFAPDAICCCSVEDEDEDEEDVDVGEEADSALALSCFFWHFSTDDVFAFSVPADVGCSGAGPRVTQENRVCGMRERLQ